MLKNLTAADVSVSAEQRAEIYEQFPILALVKSDELREKVVRLWVRTWLMSGWKTLGEIPNERIGGNTFVSHVRAVADGAYGMGKAYEKIYGVQLDFDAIICAALIHDLDKPVCFTFDKNGKLTLSEFGKIMPHGVYSTYAAFDEELPLEIAMVPVCHSAYASNAHSNTIEGILTEYADKGVARPMFVGEGGTVAKKTGFGG